MNISSKSLQIYDNVIAVYEYFTNFFSIFFEACQSVKCQSVIFNFGWG